MTRTTLALLLVLALTGCRLLEQTRHTAANALAAAVVRSMFELQSSAPAGPSSRPFDRPVARLAMSPPEAAAAVVDATASSTVPKAIAAVEPSCRLRRTSRVLKVCLKPGRKLRFLTPQIQHALQLCRRTIIIRLDENGNASM